MAVVAMLAAPQPLAACASATANPIPILARGVNMGHPELLAWWSFVLGAIASFFVYLASGRDDVRRRNTILGGGAGTIPNNFEP